MLVFPMFLYIGRVRAGSVPARPRAVPQPGPGRARIGTKNKKNNLAPAQPRLAPPGPGLGDDDDNDDDDDNNGDDDEDDNDDNDDDGDAID